jgi:hypothetical protein
VRLCCVRNRAAGGGNVGCADRGAGTGIRVAGTGVRVQRAHQLGSVSRTSGRRIRQVTTLARFPAGDSNVRLAPATNRGRLFLTVATGPHCDTPPGKVAMECPRWIPNSCGNTVAALAPGQSGFGTVFTVPGSEAISDVVPDPAGNQAALTMAPCRSTHGTTGLFVRGLVSGRARAIATSSNPCDGYGPAAWNQAGTELAFLRDRANGNPITVAGGFGCPTGRDYLALAPIKHGSTPAKLTLIRPDRGCIFRAVAFDAGGIVTDEGCNRHSPPNQGGGHLGQAVLVQYDPRGRVLTRRLLELGLEDSVIATEPRTGDVLITQDQPANSGYPERDWVWEFDGRHLRSVANYSSEDADQILAIPW